MDPEAAADSWRHTLAEIPSTFGRLVYLASLRDQDSGKYEHHGLAQVFGDAQADEAVRASHSQTFSKWLSLGRERQRDDIDLYLSSFQADRSAILATWIRLTPYRNLLPASAPEAERRQYLADLELLLESLNTE